MKQLYNSDNNNNSINEIAPIIMRWEYVYIYILFLKCINILTVKTLPL
jgi:hypothetical protein